MKLPLIIFLIVFFSSISTALEFSPTNLEFNLTQNQQSCKKVFFNLDSQTTVSNAWAQNGNVPWSITQFQTSAQDLGINMNYPVQISLYQKQAEVCLSGANSGNYKGAMIFRQGELGNSVIQFVVWLRVSISGEASQEPPQDTPTENKPKKKSRSSGGNNDAFEYTVIPSEKPKQEIQEINFNLPEEKIELGKQVLKRGMEKQNNSAFVFALLATAIIFLSLVFLMMRRRK
ncbi:hypothetical protein J4462_02795 [Candidatus Pacearchaeota archaeon]|nr:hypothetical protein [Candidatus Pacearchaeota archaeon]